MVSPHLTSPTLERGNFPLHTKGGDAANEHNPALRGFSCLLRALDSAVNPALREGNDVEDIFIVSGCPAMGMRNSYERWLPGEGITVLGSRIPDLNGLTRHHTQNILT